MLQNETNSDAVEKYSMAEKKHPVDRPPRPPGPALGPYFQFITTDLDQMLWIGSILVFRHVNYDRPCISFTSAVKVDHQWEILYENLFNMRAYRINISIELRQGMNDDKVEWHMDWNDHITHGEIFIPQYNQKWRGGFFSCNGFDATVSKEETLDFTYDTVWNHLLSEHEKTPFHVLIWGGDQNYNDFILEDIPFLVQWSKMDWNKRWTVDFDEASKREVEEYYFNNYTEHWENRPEMKKALESIPGVMMWDDHDIFDGAGSYPPLLHDSPIMLGLFELAQKMRLLFQHHTTPEKARKHRLFGYHGYNYITRCGPHLALLGMDGRTERDEHTVQHEETWNMIFDRINQETDGVHHLIVISAIPLIFARFKLAESLLETGKRIAMKWRCIPLSDHVNSVFGLPELYDDLLDEWTHESHVDERNWAVARFQEIATKKRLRVSFFSGDVHCCGVGRFNSRYNYKSSPLHDPNLMYQVISSAIVNRPPPKTVIRAAHLFGRKWYPMKDTEEQLIDFFDRSPVNGTHLFLKKLLPNRNWCFFEQTSEVKANYQNDLRQGIIERFVWFLIDFFLLCIGFLWISKQFQSVKPKEKKYQPISSNAAPSQLIKSGEDNLKVRFWLENDYQNKTGNGFTNYDLFIPPLK